tara:strand:+ start:91 stop:342 length:252 start_codon:yes stop_codon:yes gene_type:complete
MNQLKTIEEMQNIDLDDLVTYTHELYELWSQSTKIREYRYMLKNTKILLNDVVIDVPLLSNNTCNKCECEPCACTQVYGEEEE